MTFVDVKILLVALMTPFLVALLFVYGIHNRNKKLRMLSDEKMYGKILSNFSAINFRVKTLLCVVISFAYSLLMIGDKKMSNFMLKISTSRNLMKFLIVALIVEQLISTRKYYKNTILMKNPTSFENI
ncbi:MAG: hypothetical protein LBQ23_03300 [Puniceicoccales bacterium]|jgi:hypothetical protein|nr:hypothetical protein [Puniceicoccales bacterium]